jgi:hypothetical protein
MDAFLNFAKNMGPCIPKMSFRNEIGRFWRPFLALVLLACVQAPEQICNVTVDKLLLEMRQGGIEPEKNLKGQPAVDLRNLLVSLGTTMPANVDEALIFVKEDQAIIAFFSRGCLVGNITGPWMLSLRQSV